ncbi:hypothetical protein D9M68_503070 [compost metagenome]
MGVGLVDMHLDLDGALVLPQSVALHLADLDLPVIDRAALLQGAEAFGLEGEVQARQRVGEWRRLSEGGVFPRRLAFHRVDGDVDAGDQGFESCDAGQGHPRANQPEAGFLAQVGGGLLEHLDRGDHALDIFTDMQVDHLAHLDALVHQLGLARLDAVAVLEADLDFDARLAHGLPGQPEADEQRHQR